MILNCAICKCYQGELLKGKVHNKSVVLCDHCYNKAIVAINIADMASNQVKSEMPGFLADLFKR